MELALSAGPALTVLSRGFRRVGATVVVTDPEHPTGRPDTRLAFAWDSHEAIPAQGSGALTVPVGPDFLSQLRFWPAAA